MNLVKKVIKCSRLLELIHKALKVRFPLSTSKDINIPLGAKSVNSVNLSKTLSVSLLLCEI